MSAVRNYAVVTASYWAFTLTDGAIRMLVLLHFYSLGYTPFMLAFLFLLYEACGIVANLGGGWLAARFGIPRMLMTGLALQIIGLMLLSGLDPTWGAAMSVAWVVVAQGIAGVAKDITKTASKSAIKATSEPGAGQLFRWVAWFTGSKNAMKGAGFFFGGLLLESMGFRGALWLMAAVLAFVLVGVAASLPRTLGKAKASKTFRELFAKTRSVNLMAAARVFLFGGSHVARLDLIITIGLGVFGFVFAVISSLHSYLILAYAGSEKAAEDVGFYAGLEGCLWGSAIMLALCLVVTFLLPSCATDQRVVA